MERGEAPGWDAIEQAVRENVESAGEPLHWSTGVLPGQDGIYGVSAYRLPGTWFLVTFGLSELYSKESENADVSGWGFELTMRLPRSGTDGEPPSWALALLARLGAYVFTNASPFGAGHRLDPGGPITGSAGTRLSAVAFTEDRQVPAVNTANGSLQFLQVVGITDDELVEMQETSTAQVLRRLTLQSPDLVTDPDR